MLEQTIREYWTAEDLQKLKHAVSRFSNANTPFYKQCESWAAKPRKGRNAAGENGKHASESMPFGTSDFGHSFKMDKALASLSEEEMFTRIACGICGDLPEEPMKTDVSSLHCKIILESETDKD